MSQTPKSTVLNKNVVKKLSPNERFLQLCNDLIDTNYPDSSLIKEKIPINAIRSSHHTLFKILLEGSISEIIQSIDDDISALLKSKSNFDEIIYFTNSGRLENVFVLDRIKSSIQKRKISVSIWNYPKISSTLIEIKNYKSVQPFMKDNINSIYSDIYSISNKMSDIFNEIVNYVFSQQLVPFPANVINESFLRLQSKIPVNFSRDEDRDIVTESFKKYWRYKELVENYITDRIDSDPKRIISLIYKIQNRFAELNSKKEITHPVNFPSVFKTLAHSLIPPKKITISEYETCAFAIVYYFFEMCDFGERFIGEQLSLLEQINERNDTSK